MDGCKSSELKVSHAEVRDAIKIRRRGSRYWTALVKKAIRVDLAGAEFGACRRKMQAVPNSRKKRAWPER